METEQYERWLNMTELKENMTTAKLERHISNGPSPDRLFSQGLLGAETLDPPNIPDRISYLENQDRLRDVQHSQHLSAFEVFDRRLRQIEALLGL